ncbi:ARC6/PARC6 family protein [Cylindrospermopsis raciborskii]|uniref:ARC6/PARC6 family protein n=1 Tax=Cylindrospermopsis raciborskii TaxID=77022 RepID=UPI0020C83859|nr:ARC6/PARC6 family protein [Cylindrospermopsis raciborskii]
MSVSQHVGYTFTGTAGEKLSYSTDADVCLWVFTPDNQIVKGGDLSKDGKYVIQVAAPEGVKTFNLHLSLGSLQIAVATPTPESSLNIKTQNDNSSNESSAQHDISQEDALQLVQKWYAAKPQIFAPPFETGLVDQLATGKLHTFTTKANGPVEWLRQNDAYYEYNYSEIKRVLDFSTSGKRPYIKIRVSEELYLHGKNGIDKNNSGASTNNLIYFFEKENGIWKIYDYRKVR